MEHFLYKEGHNCHLPYYIMYASLIALFLHLINFKEKASRHSFILENSTIIIILELLF